MYGKVNDQLVFTCTAGVKVKTNLKGEVIELVGIDSKTRNVEIDFDNKNYYFTVFPNTTYTFNDEVEIVKEVPFDYPFSVRTEHFFSSEKRVII